MCSHLIGLKYRLGADGSAGEIDCISLVYRVLENVNLHPPPFKPAWYTMTDRQILQDLQSFTVRIDCLRYDGDIAVLGGQLPAFGATWENGLLYINRTSLRVDWKPLHSLSIRRSYRLKKS